MSSPFLVGSGISVTVAKVEVHPSLLTDPERRSLIRTIRVVFVDLTGGIMIQKLSQFLSVQEKTLKCDRSSRLDCASNRIGAMNLSAVKTGVIVIISLRRCHANPAHFMRREGNSVEI